MIVEFTRGNSIESSHEIDVVIVDSTGHVIESHGDKDVSIYPRSAIKPLQALPFVLSGAHKKVSDPMKAIALACASHSAERTQLEFLRSWHEQTRISEQDLACGPQPPDDSKTSTELIMQNKKPGRIHNNCSGKHTAMLAACQARGWPTQGYEKWDHPIQVEIRKYLTKFSGAEHDTLPWGIDGCGIPTYFTPLLAVAKMMSAFLSPSRAGNETASALEMIRDACAKEPYMIAGTDCLCSEVGAATNGRVFAKIGAEGNYAAILYDAGLAISLKARDGAFRACEAALFALIERHARLDSATLSKIGNCAMPPRKNWNGDTVGSVRVRF